MSDDERIDAWGWFKAQMERSEATAFWPAFVLLHLLLLYWAMRYTADPGYRTILDSFLMPVHEMGHPVLAVLGNFMGALGGSLFQWGLPLVVALSFLKRGDLYATAVGLFLLGVALSASYQYMDSAFQMEKYPDMVFVSLGEGEASHDWQFIFGQLGLYRGYTAVALAFRLAGIFFIWSGVLGGALVLWHLIRQEFRA